MKLKFIDIVKIILTGIARDAEWARSGDGGDRVWELGPCSRTRSKDDTPFTYIFTFSTSLAAKTKKKKQHDNDADDDNLWTLRHCKPLCISECCQCDRGLRRGRVGYIFHNSHGSKKKSQKRITRTHTLTHTVFSANRPILLMHMNYRLCVKFSLGNAGTYRVEKGRERGEEGAQSTPMFGMGLHTKLSDILNNSFIHRHMPYLSFLSRLSYLFLSRLACKFSFIVEVPYTEMGTTLRLHIDSDMYRSVCFQLICMFQKQRADELNININIYLLSITTAAAVFNNCADFRMSITPTKP